MKWPTPPWRSAPETLLLRRNEVHVWRAALDVPESDVRRLGSTLAGDERQRAERFVFQRDRTHFVVARGLLRVLLGRYLEHDPQRLRFVYGTYGKPELATVSGGTDLRFNVSHSHGLALYAVTRQRDIGVDVEGIRPEVAQETIAEHFFSPREVAVLRALPATLQATAFFACWTRKEAYIKARGDGLSLPLDQFVVSLAPGESAALLYTGWDPQEAARWALQNLAPGPGYMAAVAVAGHDWQLTCWEGIERYMDAAG
jgi:4'-phosphopantetheinyl transferase